MTDQAIKVPLLHVSTSESEEDPGMVNIEYYVGDVMIMNADIQKDIITSDDGSFDEMVLTQLMVTPHEHLACLDEVLVHSRNKETSGPKWDALMHRILSLVLPPDSHK